MTDLSDPQMGELHFSTPNYGKPNPYNVVKEFEAALCEYTGAKYAVTTTSCTTALQICFMYHSLIPTPGDDPEIIRGKPIMILPKRTYVSVPMVAKLTGHGVMFEDKEWRGWYQCKPYPVWDSARWISRGMLKPHDKAYVCLSFHWTKHLKIGMGGCIIHNDDDADPILRRMRFDGRTEGVAPKDDTFPVLGIHAYMTPALAAEGLSRLATLPDHNDPLPNDDYPDLSKLDIFK